MQPYDQDFHERIKKGARDSAEEIIPIILNLVKPISVIDVGCGAGTWLSVIKEHGINDILGIDGHYLDIRNLEIPKENFLSFDLKNPINLDRKYDLVISIEVVEHLPIKCAHIFIDSLVKLGPIILFSAAIPFQGGINHINEQWQDFWAEIFQQRGFLPIDCIRTKIWNNDKVKWWYAQNILLFVDSNIIKTNDKLKYEYSKTNLAMLSLVHPKNYLIKAACNISGLRLAFSLSVKIISSLPRLVKDSIKKLMRKYTGLV